MDTYNNRFVEVPEGKQGPQHIPFDIGEEVEIKSYRFRIAHIDAGIATSGDVGKRPTLMVLEPVGPTAATKEIVELNKLASRTWSY